MIKRILYAAATIASVAIMSVSLAYADRAIIVMDGSGSMWGQIDGKTKIEIARETLNGVLAAVPDDLELGLVVYGHREKGVCSDIEEMVAPATGNRTAISAAVNGLNPRGKTPISAAVRQAAQSLRYTEDKATVILVTDGIETCEADPCAIATELEKTGVEFTAHVVGFGLNEEEGRQVACIAQNTGGRFIQASDANELDDALTKTVSVTPSPPAYLIAKGMEDGIDRPGSDFHSFDLNTPDPALCQAACRDESQCMAWTFVKPGIQAETARCWLKNPQPQQVTNDCCISGLVDRVQEIKSAPADIRAVLTPGGPPVQGGRWDVTRLETGETRTSYGNTLDQDLTAGKYSIAFRINRIERSMELTVLEGTPASAEIVLDAGVLSLDVAYEEGSETVDGVRIDVNAGETSDTQYGSYNAVTVAGPVTVRVRSGRAEQTYDLNVIAGEALATTLILDAGRVTGSSTFTQDGEAVPSARYDVLEAQASLTGDRKTIETQYGSMDVILPPGDYVLRAKAGRAIAEKPFSVSKNALTDVVVPMNAGVAVIEAQGATRLEIVTPPSALTGEQASLETVYDATMQLILSDGTYVARARIGEDSKELEKEFTVTEGQRTEVTLP